ncbi:MAG: MFS transporter [Syntrophobacter sp.]
MKERNRILIAMSIAMALGYMPWYNFSAVLKYIAEEYRLTPADTGMILSAFQAGYVVVVTCIGWLADRMSLTRILFFATLSTGISSTLFIWGAHGKMSILVLRLLIGISAGAIYIPGIALLTKWFPSNKRGGAIGFYTGALVMAYAGGYLVASHLSVTCGWRTGVFWTSVPAFLAAGVIYLFVRDCPPDAEQTATAEASMGIAGPARVINPRPELAPRKVLTAPEGGYSGPTLISSGYMGHMWELYAFWGWVGPFVLSSLLSVGIPSDKAVGWGGSITAAIILLGVPSSWLWGIVADKKGRTFAIVIAGICSVAGEALIGHFFGHSLGLVVMIGAWIGFWGIADGSIYKTGLVEMVSPTLHGFSLGLQSAVGFFMTIISPAVFGLVLQWYNGPVEPSRATLWNPAFMVLALGGLLAPISALVLRRLPQAKLMGGGRM